MTQELVKPIEAPIEELTKEKAVRLIFWSYYFSQGSPNLQTLVTMKIKDNHPEWIPEQSWKEEIQESVIKFAKGYIQKESGQNLTHRAVDLDRISRDVKFRIDTFYSIFNQPGILANDLLLKQIANGVIRSDHEYLFKKAKRPKHDSEKTTNPFKDPMLSHYCYWVLEKHDTHEPAIDEVLHGLRSQQQLELVFGETVSQALLSEVVYVYRQTHPNNRLPENLPIYP